MIHQWHEAHTSAEKSRFFSTEAEMVQFADEHDLHFDSYRGDLQAVIALGRFDNDDEARAFLKYATPFCGAPQKATLKGQPISQRAWLIEVLRTAICQMSDYNDDEIQEVDLCALVAECHRFACEFESACERAKGQGK